MFIIKLKPGLTPKQLRGLARQVKKEYGEAYILDSDPEAASIMVSNPDAVTLLAPWSEVQETIHLKTPYGLASRDFKGSDTQIQLGRNTIGRGSTFIIAGPCSVENRAQFMETVQALKESGVHALRGGIFKPRTSPYSFNGLGDKGFELLLEAREMTGLPIVAEVLSAQQAKMGYQYIDAFQIGARSMQNFPLLNALGKMDKPVVLKRGMGNTVDELLASAEYLLRNGNHRVILCERGIRTFETSTRFTFDVSAIPVLKHKSHLPVIGDPSHATGNRTFVERVALAAVAAGANGLLVEVHPNPDEALSDSEQALSIEQFQQMMKMIRRLEKALAQD